MQVEHLNIPDVRLLGPRKHGDRRGFFSETYNRKVLAVIGVDIDFVQDNHSYSADKGTVRGLHFQTPPFAQDKLVRVARGAVFDIAVDLRQEFARLTAGTSAPYCQRMPGTRSWFRSALRTVS